ncbi:MAG TPA: DNA-directed RNA polymerase subunit F [Candidatus Aenigmarchaeota archaeon]|nr:DNA-directed RNA polymerase subunit F [Candidatus Aenigmarchaeota archaeon]
MEDVEVLEEKYVPLAKVKEIIEKNKLDLHEVNIALEHATQFSKLKGKEAEKLMKELKESGVKLKEKAIVKIVDLLPKDEEELKILIEGIQPKLSEDERKKILEIVKKYVE